MKIVVPLGFSGICAAIAAYFFKTGEPGWGALFIGIGVLVVLASIFFGAKGGA